MYNIDTEFCTQLLKELGIIIRSERKLLAAQIAIDNLALESQEHINMYREFIVNHKTFSEIAEQFNKRAQYVEMVCRYKRKQLAAAPCKNFIKNGVDYDNVVNEYYAAEACLSVDFPIHTKLGNKDTIDYNKIKVLGLPLDIFAKLKAYGFRTVAELKTHINELGPAWYEGVKGIGYEEAFIVESSMCITWSKRIGLEQGDYRDKDSGMYV